MDRTNGIAGVLITSVFPFADPVATNLYHDLEVAVYEGINGS